MLLEVLPDGLDVGQGHAEMRLEVPDPGRVRALAGHDGGPRGAAHGLLAIGAVEDHATRGQSVEVRRLDHRVTVAAEFRPEVIDRDEEHIGRLRLGTWGEEGGEQGEGRGETHGGLVLQPHKHNVVASRTGLRPLRFA